MSTTHYEIGEYAVFRVTTERLELSARAVEVYRYALEKGDHEFLIWRGSENDSLDDELDRMEKEKHYPAAVLAELCAAGLFTRLDDRGGYEGYNVTYAERVLR